MEESGLGSNEVDRLFAMVAERYGARLTAAQLEDVRAGHRGRRDQRPRAARGEAREFRRADAALRPVPGRLER